MNAKDMAAKSPEEREAFHRAAEARIATHTFVPPEPAGRPKQLAWIVKSDLLKVLIQTVYDGGENNLHYHLNSETNWTVLKGRARFYGVGDVLLADLGPMESIFLPGGSRYRFEKAGDEPLEILQAVAVDQRQGGDDQRINLESHKAWMAEKELQVYEGSPA